MSAIDAYLAELAGALRGRRRLKADLLAEARDSLIDAADAYELSGLSPTAAQERAVDDFGTVARIAPQYQTELGLSQGRRTALLTFSLLGVQHLVFAYTWSSLPDDSPRPAPAYATLANLVDQFSLAIILGAIIGAFACGVGRRYVRPDRLVVSIGRLALTTVALWLVAGTVLGVFSPIEHYATDMRYLWLHLGSVFALALIARSAWRCLRCARLTTDAKARTIVL